MYYALDIRSGDSHNIQVKTVIKDDILLGSKKFSPPLVQSESIYIFRHCYLLFTLYSEAGITKKKVEGIFGHHSAGQN